MHRLRPIAHLYLWCPSAGTRCPWAWAAPALAWLVTLLVGAAPGACWAQFPVTYNLGIEQGLPSNTVYDVLVHPTTGALYAATELGFCRYNGAEVQVLHLPRNMGLSGTGFKVDARQRVWCRSFSGQLFVEDGDSLRLWPAWQAASQDPVVTFDIDAQGCLLVATYTHVYRSDPTFSRFDTLPLSFRNMYIFSLAAAPEGGFYISFDTGMYSFQHQPNGSIRKQKLHQLPSVPFKLYSTPMGVMAASLGTSNLLLRLRGLEADTLLRPQRLPAQINELSYDGQGVVWACTQQGAVAMPLPPALAPASGYLLPQQALSCLRRNTEGTVFAGSLRKGLWGMAHLGIVRVADANHAGDIVCMQALPTGQLAVGYYTGRIVLEPFGPAAAQSTQLTGQGKPVEYIYALPNGSALWASGLSFALSGSQLLPPVPLNTSSSMKSGVPLGEGSLVALQNHVLWLHHNTAQPPSIPSLYGFTALAETDLHSPDSRMLYPAYKVRVNQQRIRALCVDQLTTGGGFYIAAADGLWWYRPSHPPQEVPLPDSSSLVARTLAQGPDGLIYAGTFDQGLWAVHEGKVCFHLDPETGHLPSPSVTQLLPLGRNLWVGTNRGLVRLACGQPQLRGQAPAPPPRPSGYFNHLDGLPADEIVALAPVGPDSLYVATHQGVVRMATAASPTNYTPPALRLVALNINDQPQPLLPRYQLGPERQDIHIHLQALALRSRGQAAFRYRLVGYADDSYQTVAASGPIILRGLPPGQYTFEAYAVNEDGVPSRQPLRFDLYIAPPFYQTLWFYLLAAVGLLAVAFVGFRLRVRAIERKNRLSQDLLRARMVALRTQMNPHFLFNALNAMQEAILLRRHHDAQHQLGAFAELLRLTLEYSEHQTIRIETELRMLELYLELEYLRFSDTLHYTLTFAPNTPRTGYTLPAMIVQPFAENALKHGLLHKTDGPRRLDIHFARRPDSRLDVTVTDNGIGRAAARALAARRPAYHRPFAEQATRHRIDLLNQSLGLTGAQAIELYIDDLADPLSQQPTGTRVRLVLPIWPDVSPLTPAAPPA